jgi:hypothetical protein
VADVAANRLDEYQLGELGHHCLSPGAFGVGLGRSGDETRDPLSTLLGYRRVHDVWQGLEQRVEGACVAA